MLGLAVWIAQALRVVGRRRDSPSRDHRSSLRLSSVRAVCLTVAVAGRSLGRLSAAVEGGGVTLEIRDVRHSFGERVALDGVSFEVLPGVLTGLLGPNGAGKTTLMRIMLGVLRPDRGEVRYTAAAVGGEDRRFWGYMPQERGLYPGMRGRRPGGPLRPPARALPSRGHPRAVPCSRSSTWRIGGMSAPTSSPAACSSGCSWRPPWCTIPR